MIFVVRGRNLFLGDATVDALRRQSLFVAGLFDDVLDPGRAVRLELPFDVELFLAAANFARDGRLASPHNFVMCASLVQVADFLQFFNLGCAALQHGSLSLLQWDAALRETESAFVCDVTHAFLARRPYVGLPPLVPIVASAAPPPCAGVASAPLFSYPDVLRCALASALPDEAWQCLRSGLLLCGGYVARTAAHLAGRAAHPPTADACDIDFFVVGAPDEALRKVRRALLALGALCKARQNGMFVVRSRYALTIGLDDCAFDLQIVLCAFDSLCDVFEHFDVDAARFAFDGRALVGAPSAVDALVSGYNVAQPRHDGPSFARRLRKYAAFGLGVAAEPCADAATLAACARPLAEREPVEGRPPPPPCVCEWEEEYVFQTSPSVGRPFRPAHGDASGAPRWLDEPSGARDEAPPTAPPTFAAYRHAWGLLRESDYAGGFTHRVVRLWRHQRRRRAHASTWRLNDARRLAARLAGAHDGAFHVGVVLQQFDAHPLQGQWNQRQVALHAHDHEAHPLKCLDFIEDAHLALPPAARGDLPRCLAMAAPTDAPFRKARRAWMSPREMAAASARRRKK